MELSDQISVEIKRMGLPMINNALTVCYDAFKEKQLISKHELNSIIELKILLAKLVLNKRFNIEDFLSDSPLKCKGIYTTFKNMVVICNEHNCIHRKTIDFLFSLVSNVMCIYNGSIGQIRLA